MIRVIITWGLSSLLVAASVPVGTALAREAFGDRVGWSDSYGLLSAAIGAASTRAIAIRPIVPPPPTHCFEWVTLWRPFPYFDYVNVRAPCACPRAY
jgi:hypothetical protein